MTRPGLIPSTRPGRATHQPLHGLQGVHNPAWMESAACAGHPQAMDPATPWEAAFVIIAYCEGCPVIVHCEQLRRQQGPWTSGIWAGKWINGQPGPYSAKHHPPMLQARQHLAELETEVTS